MTKAQIKELRKKIENIRGKVTQALKFESKYEGQRLLREIQFELGSKPTKKEKK